MQREIFAIRDDGHKYQDLDLLPTDLIDDAPINLSLREVIEFYTYNMSVKAWWPKLNLEFIAPSNNPAAPIPDISRWGATLVLSPKAFYFLEKMLLPYGEFLPIHVGEDIFQLFNCLTLVEADESKCQYEYHEGQAIALKKLVLKGHAENNLVFKTEADTCLTPFCNAQLKQSIEDFNLNGVFFDTTLSSSAFASHSSVS